VKSRARSRQILPSHKEVEVAHRALREVPVDAGREEGPLEDRDLHVCGPEDPKDRLEFALAEQGLSGEIRLGSTDSLLEGGGLLSARVPDRRKNHPQDIVGVRDFQCPFGRGGRDSVHVWGARGRGTGEAANSF
jgi:hypothetical protein